MIKTVEEGLEKHKESIETLINWINEKGYERNADFDFYPHDDVGGNQADYEEWMLLYRKIRTQAYLLGFTIEEDRLIVEEVRKKIKLKEDLAKEIDKFSLPILQAVTQAIEKIKEGTKGQ